MPKSAAIEYDEPRRRRRRSRRVEVEAVVERNLLMRALLHSPKDTLAGCVAFVGMIAIIANALFLQAGRHPAPMFNTAFPLTAAGAAPTTLTGLVPRPRPTDTEVKPVELKSVEAASAAAKGTSSQAAQASVPTMRLPASTSTRSDSAGNSIVSTRRIVAVQRALTDFGYGQLKSTGVAGTDTRAAIEKFERERRLAVTGQISDRLVHELSAVTGRAID